VLEVISLASWDVALEIHTERRTDFMLTRIAPVQLNCRSHAALEIGASFRVDFTLRPSRQS
jgi:hypothetical protein